MRLRTIVLFLILFLSLKTWSQYINEKDSKTFFKKAIPVWIDSRNVKDQRSEIRYSTTAKGRHYSRQAEQNLTVSFRTKITVNKLADIKLKLTASSDYRAFINGKFLGHGPCVAGHGYYRVDEYDLSGKLTPGDNILSIEVASYNVYTYYLLNQTGFLQAEITQGDSVLACTDTRGTYNFFEASIMDQRLQDVPLYSFQRPHIESYALTPDFAEWQINLNDKLFQSLTLEKTAKKKLIERRVKYPDYSIRKHINIIGDSIYKFQCNSTGFIGVSVIVNTPSNIILSWDEILNSNGDINPKRLKCNSYIYYKLEPGEYKLESFEPYTLQYLKVKVDYGDCKISDPYIRQYVNSDVSRATFLCNEDDLNIIFNAAVETFKQNALDVFMDCPQRERAGWLCDSYFTGRVAFDLSGNTLIEKNFLENFLMPESFEFIPEGMLPMCYPSDHANANFIPNWAMWYVLELEEYIERSGDYEMIHQASDRVMKLLDYFKAFENEFGLLENLEKWIFIEWSKANKFVQDVNYPTNMLYAKMLEVTAKLYNLPELNLKANKIKSIIREQAYDGLFFIDNAIRVDGRLVPQKDNRTETCQYYAFFCGTATPDSYPKLWNVLANDFGPKRSETKAYKEIYPSNAFIGNYLRLEILSKNGCAKQILDESIDSYLYMAKQTGTLWENIHSRASLNHGFASHIAHVFYRDFLGLKEVDIQGKKIFIEFQEVDLKSCKGTIPLGDDIIKIEWKKNGKTLQYRYTIPMGYSTYIKNNTNMKLKRL